MTAQVLTEVVLSYLLLPYVASITWHFVGIPIDESHINSQNMQSITNIPKINVIFLINRQISFRSGRSKYLCKLVPLSLFAEQLPTFWVQMPSNWEEYKTCPAVIDTYQNFCSKPKSLSLSLFYGWHQIYYVMANITSWKLAIFWQFSAALSREFALGKMLL